MADSLPGMTSKQKVTAGVFVVIVALLIWQGIGLFKGGSSTASSVPQPVMTAPTNKTNAQPSQQPQQQGPNVANAPMAQPNEQVPPPPRQMSVDPSVNDSLTKIQKDAEDKYIQQTAQLQGLKLEQQIAETNGAIANAKLAALSAEKSISDMLGASTAPPPPRMPSSAYGSVMAGGAPAQQAPITTPPPAPPAAAAAAAPSSSYTLVSVSMQLQHWTAVVGYNGKLYTVGVGDVLPPDGSVVSSINKSAVTLKKEGKEERLTIVSEVGG